MGHCTSPTQPWTWAAAISGAMRTVRPWTPKFDIDRAVRKARMNRKLAVIVSGLDVRKPGLGGVRACCRALCARGELNPHALSGTRT